MTSTGWSAQRRAAQRAAIYRWRPWEKSTGPKTSTGKAAVGRNALKSGQHTKAAVAERKSVRGLLKAIRAMLDDEATT
jgi:hypothetical protein